MRVCTARAMAAIDRETIAGGVPARELMERAGRRWPKPPWPCWTRAPEPMATITPRSRLRRRLRP